MKAFKRAIQTYLGNRAATDELFAKSYAKPGKNIDDCCQYIIGEARKRGSNAVVMSDDDVYNLAIHYYDEDNIKISSAPRARVTTPSQDVKLTASDRQRLRAEAEEQYKAQEIEKIRQAERKRKAAITAKRAEENKLFANTLFD